MLFLYAILIKSTKLSKSVNYYNCTNNSLLVDIHRSYVKYSCSDIILKSVDYEDISSYNFEFTSGYPLFRFYTENPQILLDDTIKTIASTFIFHSRIEIHFIDFPNYTSVLSYRNYFKSNDIDIWVSVLKYPQNCLWDYKMDYSNELAKIVDETNWSFVCIDNFAYLHYYSDNEHTEKDVVYLSTSFTLILACVLVGIFVFLFFSLCIIAKCRYNKLIGVQHDIDDLTP